jgi:hypothetical protein
MGTGHIDVLGRFPRACRRDSNYVLPVKGVCDAIELIVMRSERESFLDNFAADFPSQRTAELEWFLLGILRH